MSDYFVAGAGNAYNNPELQDQITINSRQMQVKKQAEELVLSSRRGTREIEINITEAIDKIQMLKESLTEWKLQAKLDTLIQSMNQHPTGEKLKLHDVAFMIEQAFQANDTSDQIYVTQAVQASIGPDLKRQNAGRINVVDTGMLPSELYSSLIGSHDSGQTINSKRVTGPAPKQRRNLAKKKKNADDPTTFDRIVGFLFGDSKNSEH